MEARAEAQLGRARADAAERDAEAERARADAGQRRIAELEERFRRMRDGPLTRLEFGTVAAKYATAAQRHDGSGSATQSRWAAWVPTPSRHAHVQASAITFISTWMAKSQRTPAGVPSNVSIALRALSISATTSDFLTRWSGS